jgi:hypothetical protein
MRAGQRKNVVYVVCDRPRVLRDREAFQQRRELFDFRLVQALAAFALLRTLQLRHPQYEVATRPVDQNGLGMTPASAAVEVARLKSMFVLLPETPAIYPVWESLVTQHRVSGKPAHDARLVAAMQVHGLTAVLTFDRTGFSRFPGIEVVNPADVTAAQ